MAGHFNMQGLSANLMAAAGFPFGVDFMREAPRWNIGETSFVDLVTRNQTDLVLVVAADPLVHLPHDIARKLSKLPLIVIDYQETLTTKFADVVIPCKISGLETGGTAVRLDNVFVPLKKLGDPQTPVKADVDILADILVQLNTKE
jgi:formylmethanofuran dehydrogenase subunit B